MLSSYGHSALLVVSNFTCACCHIRAGHLSPSLSITMLSCYMQHSMTTVRRSAYVDTEEELTSDTDLVCDLYFSVDQPCQLLGVGLCGAKQPFTAELALYEV